MPDEEEDDPVISMGDWLPICSGIFSMGARLPIFFSTAARCEKTVPQWLGLVNKGNHMCKLEVMNVGASDTKLDMLCW